MRRFVRPPVVAALLLTVAACAGGPREVAVVAPPPPIYVTPPPPMPAGGYPGMAIPAALADGSYATPNRNLTQAATMWHLRAALNVAALACRGPQEAIVVARYNALLGAQKAELKAAEARLSAEFQASGGDWRDRYDDSMTRLYNFFSQSFARDAFCAEAGAILADSATVAPGGLAMFAAARLPALDRQFTDFYRAYDAWRGGRALPRTTIAVAAAPAIAAPVMQAPAPAPAVAYAAPRAPTPIVAAAPAPAPAVATRPAPRLELDLSGLQD